MSLEKLFNKYEKECGHFDRITNKLSNRQDLHAILLLDKLSPDSEDILTAADHEVVYFNIDPDVLNTEPPETIRDLVRCGVGLDENGLYMIVT